LQEVETIVEMEVKDILSIQFMTVKRKFKLKSQSPNSFFQVEKPEKPPGNAERRP